MCITLTQLEQVIFLIIMYITLTQLEQVIFLYAIKHLHLGQFGQNVYINNWIYIFVYCIRKVNIYSYFVPSKENIKRHAVQILVFSLTD